MELSDAGLLKWLQRRVIPKNRAYVAEILKTFGLSVNDTKGIIDVCKGLSLNDSFWVVPKGFMGTFAQYNLYENRFSEILSLVAYTGIGQSDAAFTTSPELTTNGMLPKGWRCLTSPCRRTGKTWTATPGQGGRLTESVLRAYAGRSWGRSRESSFAG